MFKFKTKREYLEKFKKFKALLEMQSEHIIKLLWSNNGGEFISKEFKQFF